MRVLVTRPISEAAPWVAGLAAAGHDAVALPLIEISPAQDLQPLIKAKIGFEMMDSQAACRTYNILMGEGRKVLAAIILEKN